VPEQLIAGASAVLVDHMLDSWSDGPGVFPAAVRAAYVALAVASWYEPLEIWRAWADDVHGGPVAAGHFLAEEAPEETAGQLLGFLS
jgi:haloacetate dehalogenase